MEWATGSWMQMNFLFSPFWTGVLNQKFTNKTLNSDCQLVCLFVFWPAIYYLGKLFDVISRRDYVFNLEPDAKVKTEVSMGE